MALIPAVALLSAASLAYEILLTRLFAILSWHHVAFMVISVALLGIGASGTVLALARRALETRFATSFALASIAFGVSTVGGVALVRLIAFNPLALVWSPGETLLLLALYVVLALPFLASGLALGLALAHLPKRIGAIYSADLAGAALGALGVIGALAVLPLDGCFRLVSGLGVLAAALALLWARSRVGMVLAALLAPAIALAWPAAWLVPAPSPYKGLSIALQAEGARVIAERSSPLGQLNVVASPLIPFRHAPGLSLNATSEPPPQLGVFTDGDAMTAITRLEQEPASLFYLDQLTAAAPFQLVSQPRTLVLGAGGGTDVLLALAHRARHVDAVELNPDLVDLVRHEFAGFAGGLYDRGDVTVHVAEARSFVERTRARYDIVHLGLLESFAATAGTKALAESPIYTVEAFRTYLARLEPGGFFAVTSWLQAPPRAATKLLATAVAALEAEGVEAPGERLTLIHGFATATLIIKNGRFGAAEIARLEAFARQRSFDIDWLADSSATAAAPLNRLSLPDLRSAGRALLGPERARFIADHPFDVAPATDDRPFFHRFFRWGLLPELAALRGQGGLALIDSGYLFVVATLAQALAAGLLLVVLPLLLLKRAAESGSGLRLRVGLYFTCLGVGFMFVELAFIHRLSVFLGHPIAAVVVGLGAFLLAAGAGSGFASRVGARWPRAAPRLMPLAVAAIGLIEAAVLPSLFDHALGWPLAGRVVLAALVISPLGLAMGLPFPLGLRVVADAAPRLTPWAWATNGCASVAGAVLASLLANHLGFTAVIGCALVLYLGASLAAPIRAPV